MNIETHFLGKTSYDEGLLAQAEVLANLKENQQTGVVLGLEHETVITLGVRGDEYSDLVVKKNALEERGVVVRKTERGGQAAIHSPGQLLIYPCLNLKQLRLGAKDFVCLMTKVTADALRVFHVEANSKSTEPGLFVGEKKIAAFGFKISHGFTSHGIAINVANDLSYFDLIRTCGVSGQPMTSLKQEAATINRLESVFHTWCRHLEARLTEVAGDN